MVNNEYTCVTSLLCSHAPVQGMGNPGPPFTGQPAIPSVPGMNLTPPSISTVTTATKPIMPHQVPPNQQQPVPPPGQPAQSQQPQQPQQPPQQQAPPNQPPLAGQTSMASCFTTSHKHGSDKTQTELHKLQTKDLFLGFIRRFYVVHLFFFSCYLERS